MATLLKADLPGLLKYPKQIPASNNNAPCISLIKLSNSEQTPKFKLLLKQYITKLTQQIVQSGNNLWIKLSYVF